MIQLERLLHEYGQAPEKEEPPPEDVGVGELEVQGFHVGTAPPDARPDSPASSGRLSPEAKRCGVTMLDYKETDVPEGVWECESEFRNDAFLEFKHTTEEGMVQENMLKTKHIELKAKRRYARDICACVNEAKHEIQEIKKLLEEGSTGNPENAGVDDQVDTTRVHLMNRFKVVKAAYHKAYNELKDVKVELEALQQEVRDCKQKLLESFYTWFDNLRLYKGEETDRFLAAVS